MQNYDRLDLTSGLRELPNWCVDLYKQGRAKINHARVFESKQTGRAGIPVIEIDGTPCLTGQAYQYDGTNLYAIGGIYNGNTKQ